MFYFCITVRAAVSTARPDMEAIEILTDCPATGAQKKPLNIAEVRREAMEELKFMDATIAQFVLDGFTIHDV